MQKEHPIIQEVYGAKKDSRKADELNRSCLPFIRSETAKCISRICTDQDDEYSIALIAFHEAILGYEKNRGAFFNYASMLIRSRIIDYQRKEARHQGQVSLAACASAIRFAAGNQQLLDEVLKTGKLPLGKLVQGSGAERKTLERHRKYILAMLLIQTNGYEIIRGHLRHVLKGGRSA